VGESKSERWVLVSPLSPALTPASITGLCFCPTRSLRQLRQREQEHSDEQWRDRLYVYSSVASTCAPLLIRLTSAAYVAATVASCSIAVGLSQLVPRLRVSPSAKALLGKLVPFAAVASAGCVNIGLMRWKEMRDGKISVFVLGESISIFRLTIALSITCLQVSRSMHPRIQTLGDPRLKNSVNRVSLELTPLAKLRLLAS